MFSDFWARIDRFFKLEKKQNAKQLEIFLNNPATTLKECSEAIQQRNQAHIELFLKTMPKILFQKHKQLALQIQSRIDQFGCSILDLMK